MIERPTSATIIGWLFIGLSVVMVLSGTMAAVVWSHSPADQFSPNTDAFHGEPWAFRMMFKMFDHFQYLIVIQFMLAAAGIAGGFGLLQLRPWGRALTELLTWLGLLYTLGFSLLWLTAVASFQTSAGMPPDGRFFAALMFAMGVVVLLTFLVPFVVVLVALRGKKIRSAIEWKARETPGQAQS